MGVIGDALQLDAVHKKLYFFFYYKSHEIHISTISHVRICIRYYKSHVPRLNVQWNQEIRR